jgi:alanine racemase
MTLRLSVETAAWQAHLSNTVQELGATIPVVKGNGYGFGRAVLMEKAAKISSEVAVGSVHELTDVPPSLRPFVLTPVGHDRVVRDDAVLTVGSSHDLGVLQRIGSRHTVVVKIETSMRRYGVAVDHAEALRREAEAAGHRVEAWSLHLPLVGSEEQRANEAITVASQLADDLPIHVSHIGTGIDAIRIAVNHTVVARAGTRLWLGDKSMLSLHADCIAVRPARSGTHAGYRHTAITRDGHLVMVGCGSSHGVAPLDDGRSPFHFARHRLDMLEAPHMHTTMLIVGDQPLPSEGDWVDVQQPMTRVHPDVIDWR